MIRLTILFTILFHVGAFSTEQKPDILIIETDTLLLDDYPLEQLNLNQRPFNLATYTVPTSDCWRGYIAVWEIKNDSLLLTRLISTDSSKIEAPRDLLTRNGITFTTVLNSVFANWVAMDLIGISMSFENTVHYLIPSSNNCPYGKRINPKNVERALVIKNGIVAHLNLNAIIK